MRKKQKIVLSVLIVPFICIILVIWYVFVESDYRINHVQAVSERIDHPSGASSLYDGQCHGSPATSPTCGFVYHCNILTFSSPFSRIADFYTEEFANFDWEEVEVSGKVFSVDDNTRLEILEIAPESPLPLSVETATYNSLRIAWVSGDKTYMIITYNWQGDCSLNK